MADRIVGISEGYHDAAVSIIENNEIVFASHSERYSGIKNHMWISPNMPTNRIGDVVAYYEKPLLKNIRRKLF